MDTQSPLTQRLLRAVAAITPGSRADDDAARSVLKATDAAEAQHAALGILAAEAAIDSFDRAGRAGARTSLSKRLSDNAMAAAGVYMGTRRTLHRRGTESE